MHSACRDRADWRQEQKEEGGNCGENVTQPVSLAAPPEVIAASSEQEAAGKTPKGVSVSVRRSYLHLKKCPLISSVILQETIISLTAADCVRYSQRIILLMRHVLAEMMIFMSHRGRRVTFSLPLQCHPFFQVTFEEINHNESPS